MTEFQRLFLVQARSNFAVFQMLWEESRFPTCHALHYLQMAAEMLGKAHAWKTGPNATSHRAFVGFLKSVSSNRKAQQRLGFAGQNANWGQMIRKVLPLAQRVEDLAPALSPDGPNPEYPWPRMAPVAAPAEFVFGIWTELRKSAPGRQLLYLTERLCATAEAFL